eukprot:TRINITY_DN3414_c0_g1_i2.p1 TRINITY_DN3414_c0_g1~~TRINITY_DN3414_c0_g1_i2.p1  ORF type:complete len:549 (+),score=61.84 TRINITY_DN3414_c0_g1_i2:145-1791(+)
MCIRDRGKGQQPIDGSPTPSDLYTSVNPQGGTPVPLQSDQHGQTDSDEDAEAEHSGSQGSEEEQRHQKAARYPTREQTESPRMPDQMHGQMSPQMRAHVPPQMRAQISPQLRAQMPGLHPQYMPGPLSPQKLALSPPTVQRMNPSNSAPGPSQDRGPPNTQQPMQTMQLRLQRGVQQNMQQLHQQMQHPQHIHRQNVQQLQQSALQQSMQHQRNLHQLQQKGTHGQNLHQLVHQQNQMQQQKGPHPRNQQQTLHQLVHQQNQMQQQKGPRPRNQPQSLHQLVHQQNLRNQNMQQPQQQQPMHQPMHQHMRQMIHPIHQTPQQPLRGHPMQPAPHRSSMPVNMPMTKASPNPGCMFVPMATSTGPFARALDFPCKLCLDAHGMEHPLDMKYVALKKYLRAHAQIPFSAIRPCRSLADLHAVYHDYPSCHATFARCSHEDPASSSRLVEARGSPWTNVHPAHEDGHPTHDDAHSAHDAHHDEHPAHDHDAHPTHAHDDAGLPSGSHRQANTQQEPVPDDDHPEPDDHPESDPGHHSESDPEGDPEGDQDL